MDSKISNKQSINPHYLWAGAFIPNWLCRRTEISQGAKLCYARLSQFAGKDDGVCIPAQDALAAELGVDSHQARRYICELERLGLIEIVQRGLQQSNGYRFLAHPWMEFARKRADSPDPDEGKSNFPPERKIERKKATKEDYINAYKIYEHWNSKKQEVEDLIVCTESFDGIKFRLKGAVGKRNADDICKAIDNYVSAIGKGHKARYSLIEFLYRIDRFMPQNFRSSDFNSNFNYNNGNGNNKGKKEDSYYDDITERWDAEKGCIVYRSEKEG
jgi:hypothetical protein